MECLRKHQSALRVTKNGVIEKLMVLIQTVCHLLLKFFHVFLVTLLSKATTLSKAWIKTLT